MLEQEERRAEGGPQEQLCHKVQGTDSEMFPRGVGLGLSFLFKLKESQQLSENDCACVVVIVC